MEESDLILAELRRIRVLLTRLVVFVALFLLLVVAPVLGWLSWVGYAWTLKPLDLSSKSSVAEFPQADAKAMKFAQDVPEMARKLEESLLNLVREAYPSSEGVKKSRFPIVESTSTFVRKALPVESK